MASPEWFFSTLAQSSAAIIGFVLAFSAVLHQLERQQREKRTDTLREEFIDFKERYSRVVLALRDLFSVVADEFVTSRFERTVYEGTNELEPEFPDQTDVENPVATEVWYYANSIETWLKEVEASEDPNHDYLLTVDELENLRIAVQRISERLAIGEGIDALFPEVNPGLDESSGVKSRLNVFGLVEGENHDSQFNDDSISRRTADYEEDLATELVDWISMALPRPNTSILNGKNLASAVAVAQQLKMDFEKLDAHTQNTLLDYEPIVSRNIIKGSAFLALTGVFTPIALLLTLPQSAQIEALSGWSLTGVQAVVLVLSAISTAYLLSIILKNLDGTWTGLLLTERLHSRISDRKN